MGCENVPNKCTPKHVDYIPSFWGFTEFTPTIPKLYWNVHSQEQRILRICDLLDKLICYSEYLGDNVDFNREEIEKLKSEFEEFKEHGFDDYYADQVEAWIASHLEFIYEHTVKQIYFGVTEDGYFVAYIPDSWDDITFDTIMNFSSDHYGCLTLSY